MLSIGIEADMSLLSVGFLMVSESLIYTWGLVGCIGLIISLLIRPEDAFIGVISTPDIIYLYKKLMASEYSAKHFLFLIALEGVVISSFRKLLIIIILNTFNQFKKGVYVNEQTSKYLSSWSKII